MVGIERGDYICTNLRARWHMRWDPKGIAEQDHSANTPQSDWRPSRLWLTCQLRMMHAMHR